MAVSWSGDSLPEDADGYRDVGSIKEIVGLGSLEPLDFNTGRGRHGYGHDAQADAHALQPSESTLVTRVSSGHRHKHPFVDWGPAEDADEVEEGDRGWRDVVVADSGVHRCALHYEQGEHLRVNC